MFLCEKNCTCGHGLSSKFLPRVTLDPILPSYLIVVVYDRDDEILRGNDPLTLIAFLGIGTEGYPQ
jgi:hypothetical protein